MTTADTYGALLEREVPVLADAPIYRLVHDDLSEHWHPVWFAEFAEHAARHGLGYVGEADLYSLRTEMLPEGVEPEVWQLAGGDRIAFENYSDLLTARHFRQSVLCHAGAAGRRRARPGPRAAAALGGAPERRAARGRPARRRVRRARPPSPAARRLRRTARRARRRPGRAGRGAARRLPARAPDPARRPAARRDATPASARVASPLARWQAAQGADMISLAYMTRAHGGAGRAAADHAARRHARPRGDPRRAAGARRPRAERRRPRRATWSSSPGCSCWSLAPSARTPSARPPCCSRPSNSRCSSRSCSCSRGR